MKKILLLLTMVCALFTMPAKAQVGFGFKGGVEVSKLKVSGSIFDSDNRPGFFIGPTLDFTLPIVGLGMDVSALYTQSNCKVTESNVKTKSRKSKSIEVPVNLKWSFGLGSALGIYIAAGPQFGFNISEPEHYNSKKCVFSANLGGGVKIFRHFEVGAHYNWGLSKFAEYEEEGGIRIRKNGWNLSLAYMF